MFVSFLMFDMKGATGSPNDETSRPFGPRASTMTVEMLGTVDAVNDPTHILDGSVTVGTDIRVVYRMFTDASPAPFSQPHMADYWGAIKPAALRLQVGGYSLQSGPGRIQVTMVDGGTNADGLFDGWYVYAPKRRVRGLDRREDFTIFLSLYDATAQALDSTALVPLPSLEAWSEARIGMSRTDTTGAHLFIAGEIISIRAVD
jgi:hypothetical protein